ncbi:hypothetical protein JW960_04420 [candidate division KSB1 bacterium]|nr:hypothetical protein [candidate division KSB1 bacterium]
MTLTDHFEQPFIIKFTGEIERFATRSGNRLFLNPNMLNRCTADDIPRDEDRQFPVYLHYPPTPFVLHCPTSTNWKLRLKLLMHFQQFGVLIHMFKPILMHGHLPVYAVSRSIKTGFH